MSAMGLEGLSFPTGPDRFPGMPTVGAPSTDFTAGGPQGPTGPTGSGEFGQLLIDGIDRLEGITDHAADLSVQAATGQLENIHDYTIAATEASVATQLTVSMRNKAVEAFNEIMRMSV